MAPPTRTRTREERVLSDYQFQVRHLRDCLEYVVKQLDDARRYAPISEKAEINSAVSEGRAALKLTQFSPEKLQV